MFPRTCPHHCPQGAGFHFVSDEELDRDPEASPPPIDFAPVLAAGRQVTVWLLDVARSRIQDPLDLAAIDRVQRATEALASGTNSPGCVATEQDILIVVGILVTAFEIDCGLGGLSDFFGAMYAAADQVGAPLLELIRGSLSRRTPKASRASVSVEREPIAPRTVARIPVVVRRRPSIAHGVDELGQARTVLVIG